MSDREAAIRLAGFIERQKSGDDPMWQYDPRPDIEVVLAELAAARADAAVLAELPSRAVHAELAAAREREERLREVARWEAEHGGCACRTCAALADGEGET